MGSDKSNVRVFGVDAILYFVLLKISQDGVSFIMNVDGVFALIYMFKEFIPQIFVVYHIIN